MFIAKKSNLLEAINKVSNCSIKRTVEQSGLLLMKGLKASNEILFVKNNYEFSIISKLTANIKEDFCLAVNCDELISIIKLMPDNLLEVSLTPEGSVMLKYGKTKMILPVAKNSFIEWEKENLITEIELSEVVFRYMIERVAFSAMHSKEDHILSSIKISVQDDKMCMTACDTTKISLAVEKIKPTGVSLDFLIPAQQLVDLSGLLSDLPGDNMKFKISQKGYVISLTDKSVEVCGTFHHGIYPTDVKSIMKKKPKCFFEVDYKELFQAVERATFVSRNGNTPLVIEIENSIKLKTQSFRNIVEDEVFGKIKGEKLKIGVNPKKLLEMLRGFPDEKIIIGYSSERDPLIVYTGKGKRAVLPVLIKEE